MHNEVLIGEEESGASEKLIALKDLQISPVNLVSRNVTEM
jgi:hypothetical protein